MSTTLPAPPVIAEQDARSALGAPSHPAAPLKPARERLLSLDVFRGMTVAGMLLVNDPGTWGAIYPPLEHAEWHGWTPTDLIFPFFLFIVGITTHLSMSVRRARGDDDGALARQILKRGALIFLFGFLLSWFPFFQWDTVKGIADPTFLERVVYRVQHVRIMGVLQRIGLAYIICGLITLRTTLKQQVVIATTMLFGYWIAMTAIPVPPHGVFGLHVLHIPGATLDAWLDRVILTPDHLWVGGGGLRDPEGLLSTIPAAVTAMLGVFAGRWIATARPLTDRLAGLFAGGALAMVGGLVWNWVFPINKSLWTSSYTLFCAGMGCVALGVCMWIVDLHKRDRWTKPFVVYGVNPMLAFLGSGLVARLIYSIFKVNYQGQRISLEAAIYKSLFASWLSPINASLAFALCFVFAFYLLLSAFYRRGIILKV